MPLDRPTLTGHPLFPKDVSAVEIMKDLTREIRANPTDYAEVMGNIFAAVVAARSIDDPIRRAIGGHARSNRRRDLRRHPRHCGRRDRLIALSIPSRRTI